MQTLTDEERARLVWFVDKRDLTAPVAEGTAAGAISLHLDSGVLWRGDLITATDGPAGSLWRVIIDGVRRLFGRRPS